MPKVTFLKLPPITPVKPFGGFLKPVRITGWNPGPELEEGPGNHKAWGKSKVPEA